jgi:hypothetical protein
MRYALLVIGVCSSLFAQATIPIPSSCSAFMENAITQDSARLISSGATSISYTRPTSSALNSLVPAITQDIGDFDGDKSDDIFIVWQVNVNVIYYHQSTQNGTDLTVSMFGVYSHKKSTYLLQEAGNATRVETGDFNGDSLMEFIIGNKIYQSTSVLTKKKAL